MNTRQITKWWAKHAPDLAVAELPRTELLYEEFNSTFDEGGELSFIESVEGDFLSIESLYRTEDIDLDHWFDDEPEPEEESESDDWDFI